MKKQCAAVRTHCAAMMVPPQMWIGPYCTLTCQGHLATEVSFPPMIRPEILCPQAAEESRAQRGGKPGAGRAQHPHHPQALGTFIGARGNAICVALYYPDCLLENALFAQPCAKKGGKCSQANVWPFPPSATRPASQGPYLCIGGRRTFP